MSDAKRSARQAGLRWVDPGEPGIERLRKGTAFAYRTAAGSALRADEQRSLQLLHSLARARPRQAPC